MTILGSGSEGNALLLESATTSILVDAGLSHRKLLQRFAAIGRDAPKNVAAVIVTHSHTDHAAHASTYATRLSCPVRASEAKATTVGLVTDLGHVPKGLEQFLGECETLLLESNHDPDMLEMGPYPEMLKRRVAGSLGHLSNGQTGDLLAGLPHAPKRVVLMHLSETNNSPRLARSSAEAALGHQGTELLLAKQQQPLELDPGHDQQLQLGV
ncbi:MAG: MBL fold metallo-hydrolase [Deltaproteobacteria bacterium]|nr:MBL fold metallo-hydrolase [Deltaproteobacteria bacterium]